MQKCRHKCESSPLKGKNKFVAFVWVFLFLFRASLLIYSLPTPFMHLDMANLCKNTFAHERRVQSSLSVCLIVARVLNQFSFSSHFSSSSCFCLIFTYATLSKRLLMRLRKGQARKVLERC